MSDVDALIVALADGRTMREAAATVRMPSAAAVRAARERGWPDLDAIRLAADEIRERLSREETPVPPRKPEPIPIEPDVEQAMTPAAGAALVREARASALDRDETHSLDNWETSERGIPGDLDAVVDHTDQHETAQAAKPCHLHHLDNHLEAGDHVSADGIWGTAIQCPGCRDALVLDPDELQPGRPPDPVWRAGDVTDEQLAADVPHVASVEAIDRELIADTTEVLQLVERIARPTERPLHVLTVEQRQRAVALREASDITLGMDPVLADLLVVADYIVTGTQPAVYVSGHLTAGGEA